MHTRNKNTVSRIQHAAARLWRRATGDRGGIMLETVVAVMVLGVVGTTVLSGLSTARKAGADVDGQAVAENLARNQMEYVFSLPYQDPATTYATIPGVDQGYAVTAAATEHIPSETRIEKVTVVVSRNGSDLLTLETLRTKE